MTALFGLNGAEFSECRKYRYSLWRTWDGLKPWIMFIGLNPSTANESQDDATIRRVVSMAMKWGYGRVYMMNCFPFISKDPDKLKDFGNTAKNDHSLYRAAELCAEIVFAWGAFKIVRDTGRDIELHKMFPNAKALIINKDGSPRHPLFVPTQTALVNYTVKGENSSF